MFSFLYDVIYTHFGRASCIPLYTGQLLHIAHKTPCLTCTMHTYIFTYIHLADTDSLVLKIYSEDMDKDLKYLSSLPVLDTCRTIIFIICIYNHL